MLDEGLTLEQVGAVMGLTRERVRQLEERGLEKLRIALVLEERLGRSDAAPLLRQLRGKPIVHFREFLCAAEEQIDEESRGEK